MIPLRGPRTVVAEAALALVSLTVAWGFTRLFSEGRWAVPLMTTVVLAHLAGAVCRRAGLGPVVQLGIVSIGTFLLAAWFFAADTLRLVLPTAETLSVLGSALDEALTLYPEAKAPTDPVAGFVVAAMIGMAIVATMADIAAFRLDAEIQALIPPATLFVFCSVLGSGQYRLAAAGAFGLSCLIFVLIVRNLARTTTTWLPGDAERGPRAMVRAGGSLALVAAVIGLVVGPSLPGADDEGLWTWKGGGGSDSRVVVNPLVDIRSRLVNQSNEVAFTVTTSDPSYWRLMALDDFDGERFGLGQSSFRPARGELTSGLSDGESATASFVIDALDSPYLPAGFPAQRVEATVPVRWDDRSQTLLLDEGQDSRRLRYEVESVLRDLDPEMLRQATTVVPNQISDRYLVLPDLDQRVVDLADEVVADADTPYDRALALQEFFRSEFDYSIEVTAGHSDSALVSFLFDTRTGYCEQFSVAYAAMARSVGLPSRVAVGFTPGERSRGNSERFTVRGEHAHAWPEVWFEGIGWVPFEPTPGRGDPRSERHTGVPDDQSGGPVGDGAVTTTTTTAPGDSPTTTFDLDAMPPIFDEVPMDADGSSGAGATDDGLPRWLMVGAGAVLAVLAWTALVSAARVGRIVLRRRRADSPGARVLAAWDEVLDAAHDLRIRPRADETDLEVGHRVAAAMSGDHEDTVRSLATTVTAARYAPAGSVTDESADAAVESAAALRSAITEGRGARQRLLDAADPRRVVPRRRARTVRRRATFALPSLGSR
ncbi:MAG: transglutaminase family protein [Acidimicrobiales bacterium]